MTGKMVGYGFWLTHTTKKSSYCLGSGGKAHTVTSTVSPSFSSHSLGSTKNTSVAGLPPLVDVSKPKDTVASKRPLLLMRKVSELVLLVTECTRTLALASSLSMASTAVASEISKVSPSPSAAKSGAAMLAVCFQVSKGPNSYTPRFTTKRFGTGALPPGAS